MKPKRLFDEFARTETRTRNRNEPMFAYLNTSSRNPVVSIRTTLEEWFSEIQGVNQKDLRSRFRSFDDETHLAALFELYVYSS